VSTVFTVLFVSLQNHMISASVFSYTGSIDVFSSRLSFPITIQKKIYGRGEEDEETNFH
jgi:hypothetical protein